MKTAIDRVLGWVLIVLVSVMTINVLWQVFSRYVLSAPSSFTDELARFLLIWVGILGGAYAAGQGAHLAIELLPQRLDEKGRHRLEKFIAFAILVFAVTVMIIGGSRLVLITYSLGQISAALKIPMAIVYAVLPIAGLVVSIYQLITLSQLMKAGPAKQQ